MYTSYSLHINWRTSLGYYIGDHQRGIFVVQERVDNSDNGRSQRNGQILYTMKAN